MKSKFRSLTALLLVGLLVAVLTACGTSNNAETNTVETAPNNTAENTIEDIEEEQPADQGPVVLTLIGVEDTVELTMAELMAMDVIEGWAGTKSSAGIIVPSQRIKGVRMTDLADLVGGLTEDYGINIIAKDGYGITMSYDQITNGSFITYDPGTGDENQVDEELIPVVAFERDGAPIPEDEDGPLRIFVISEENNQLVDGHWTVKWVAQLEMKPVASDWILYLEGVITQDLDRASFESCATSGCHQASWTDEDGNEWSGVPLFYIAGRVDDGVEHEDRAFNDAYAEAGYSIELFAADGYNVSVASQDAMFNFAMILANQYNGEPLDEENFPLRLVGDELTKEIMVGHLSNIVLNPKEGVTPPSEDDAEVLDLSLPEGAVMKVVGAVRNQLTLELDNLKALGVQEDFAIEHPKNGTVTYTGVLLSDVLSFAGLEDDAAALVLHASDGFSSELPMADVLACANCLVAFNDDGTLSMAMDGLSTKAWVGGVVALQVKAGEVVEEEAPEEEEEPEGDAIGTPSDMTVPEGLTLEVAGTVFTADDLNALGVLDVEAEHPKNGLTMYAGIPLSVLFEAAGVGEDASILKIIASDGYSVEAAFSDVLACAKCLVAIGDDALVMVMEGLPSNTWVKSVVTLEIN